MDVDGVELCPSSSIDNNESSTKSQKVCWYWRRGKCSRHPCRYQHRELPTVGNSSSSRSIVKKFDKPRNKRVQKTRFYGDGYKYMYECSTGGSDINEVDYRVGDESESMIPSNIIVGANSAEIQTSVPEADVVEDADKRLGEFRWSVNHYFSNSVCSRTFVNHIGSGSHEVASSVGNKVELINPEIQRSVFQTSEVVDDVDKLLERKRLRDVSSSKGSIMLEREQIKETGNSNISSKTIVKKIDWVQQGSFNFGDGCKDIHNKVDSGSNNEVDSSVGNVFELINPSNAIVEAKSAEIQTSVPETLVVNEASIEDADKLFERKRLREVYSSNGEESGSSSKRVRYDILEGPLNDSAKTIFNRFLDSNTRQSLRQVPRSELNAEAKHRFLEMGHILQGYMDQEEDIDARELMARKEGYREGVLSMTRKSRDESSVASNKQIVCLEKVDDVVLSHSLIVSMAGMGKIWSRLVGSLARLLFANRELKNSLDESLRVRNSLIFRLAEISRDWTKVMGALLESRRENKRLKVSLELMTKERDQLKAKAEIVGEFVSKIRQLES